jgi:hypothetical protein
MPSHLVGKGEVYVYESSKKVPANKVTEEEVTELTDDPSLSGHIDAIAKLNTKDSIQKSAPARLAGKR